MTLEKLIREKEYIPILWQSCQKVIHILAIISEAQTTLLPNQGALSLKLSLVGR